MMAPAQPTAAHTPRTISRSCVVPGSGASGVPPEVGTLHESPAAARVCDLRRSSRAGAGPVSGCTCGLPAGRPHGFTGNTRQRQHQRQIAGDLSVDLHRPGRSARSPALSARPGAPAPEFCSCATRLCGQQLGVLDLLSRPLSRAGWRGCPGRCSGPTPGPFPRCAQRRDSSVSGHLRAGPVDRRLVLHRTPALLAGASCQTAQRAAAREPGAGSLPYRQGCRWLGPAAPDQGPDGPDLGPEAGRDLAGLGDGTGGTGDGSG